MKGLLLTILLSSWQMPISPIFQDTENASKMETASKFAVKAATIAGGARKCAFDKNLVDEYISLAYAHIKVLSKDKEENILAKMDFTNALVVASVSQPEGGCKAFEHTFRTSLHDLG